MNDLKLNDKLIVVHTIDGNEVIEGKVRVPDPRVSKPYGVYHQEGNQTVFFQRLIQTDVDGVRLSISAPNEISLSLSISQKSRHRANDIRSNLSKKYTNPGVSIFEDDVGVAYDFLEEMHQSVVFSYRAVESFCNAAIPDDYVYKKKNSKGVEEHYRKEQVERWISTSEKVTEILPGILGIEAPVKEVFWSRFKELERLRNDIVHSKSSSSAATLAELFSSFMNDRINSSVELLEYFVSKDPVNQAFPLGFGVSKIKVVSLKDAGEMFELDKDG